MELTCACVTLRYGPTYPNSTSHVQDPNYSFDCGDGCLFNVDEVLAEEVVWCPFCAWRRPQ